MSTRRFFVPHQRQSDYQDADMSPVGGLQRSATTGGRRPNLANHDWEWPRDQVTMVKDSATIDTNTPRPQLQPEISDSDESDESDVDIRSPRAWEYPCAYVSHGSHLPGPDGPVSATVAAPKPAPSQAQVPATRFPPDYSLVGEVEFPHRDYERLLQRNDARDMGLMKQEAEIARLERKLAGHRKEHEARSRTDHVLPVEGCQLVLSPHVVKDSTVHFEMDIEEDLEVQLEEFSRLRRLGRFDDAKEMFQCGLAEHMAYSFLIFIEYADMLYDQGHYRDFLALMCEYSQHWTGWEVSASDSVLIAMNKTLAETLSGGYPGTNHRHYLAKTHRLFVAERDIDIDCIKVFAGVLHIWVHIALLTRSSSKS